MPRLATVRDHLAGGGIGNARSLPHVMPRLRLAAIACGGNPLKETTLALKTTVWRPQWT